MKQISLASMRKFSFQIILLSIQLFLFSCKAKEVLVKKTDQLKSDKLKVPVSYDYTGQVVKIKVSNPFRTPIRVKVTTENQILTRMFRDKGPLTLSELKDSVFIIPAVGFENKPLLGFTIRFGDFSKKIEKKPIALPFPKGKTSKIIQGYMGSFSHKDEQSRYAIDFAFSIGDTVCSVADGYVVGVVQTSKTSGRSEKYINDANYITLYHPDTGLFTQYVHLAHQGAVVQIGDEVKKGQPIGFIGMSGFTTSPHLHFSVLMPMGDDWVSTPISFEKGYRGIDLKRGQRITN